MSGLFTDDQMAVIAYCAEEVRRQQAGSERVADMLRAWNYACGVVVNPSLKCVPGVSDVITIGKLCEPVKNEAGLRRCGVRVGMDVKMPWERVPIALAALTESWGQMTPDDAYFAYQEIHPFRDGNGRSGKILRAMLAGELHAPSWPPNKWGIENP